MSGPFLCVCGHTNLDYIITLDHFPPKNTSINVLEKKLYFGGTAANVATLAAGLGVPTSLVSYVGSDLPGEFRSMMVEKGVDLSDLVEVQGSDTPTVWVMSDREHDQIAFVYQGAMGRMDEMEPRLDQAGQAKYVHIMTGRPKHYISMVKGLQGLGASISFDPAQEIHHVWDAVAFREMLDQAEAFFGNENELRTALSYMAMERPEQLLSHVGLVVITRGARGCLVLTQEETLHVPAVRPKAVVDTTGAGDAFRAGFYAGLYRGKGMRDCAVYGAATSSFVVEARGALTNIPTWDQVRGRADPYL
jgi:sugar/nucleoside kinase (ribokinase family)